MMVQARMVLTPQLGFNNNVRHKGRVFHIQTEDSGIHHPHVTTHLFADGGRILRSVRTDYSELLESDELSSLLRARMKEQHRAMFVALREGHFDALIDQLPSESGTRDIERSVEPSVPPTTKAGGAGRARSSSRPGVKRASQRPQREGPRVEGTSDAGDRTSRTRLSERAAAHEDGSGKSSTSGAAATRPSLSGGDIYGNPHSISEQSLDDVILSYISQDLDGE